MLMKILLRDGWRYERAMVLNWYLATLYGFPGFKMGESELILKTEENTPAWRDLLNTNERDLYKDIRKGEEVVTLNTIKLNSL